MAEKTDVLKPSLIWVDGQCYRSFDNAASANSSNVDSCLEKDHLSDDSDDESKEFGIEILPYGSSKFKHSFYVAKPLFPFIVGAKNATRKKLELETRTTIQIPGPNQDGDITIIGVNHKSIVSARNRIDLLVETCRKKMRITHFLSIPLVDEIKSGYKLFHEYVMENCVGSCTNVDDVIMQKPYKLHITIGALLLLDNKERKKAVKVFNDCNEEVINPFLKQHSPIVINIQGVQIMNEKPTNASVLYGKVISENESLQKLANEIVDYFAKSGLMKERTNNVKLHATFMNTYFKIRNKTKRIPKKETEFDARQILDKFEDTLFGTMILKEIHLSQCGTASEDTYYEATAKVTFDQQ